LRARRELEGRNGRGLGVGSVRNAFALESFGLLGSGAGLEKGLATAVGGVVETEENLRMSIQRHHL
jgi:hypothetical protein